MITAAKKKSNRGGANRGQGRHLKYGEPTSNQTFRCPVSKGPELRALVNKMLERWALAEGNNN